MCSACFVLKVKLKMLASGESAKRCIGKQAVTDKVTFARQAANEPVIHKLW